jgi:hypothetical protein
VRLASFRPGRRPFHELAWALVPLLEGPLSETRRLIEAMRLADALAQGALSLTDAAERIVRGNGHDGVSARRRPIRGTVHDLSEPDTQRPSSTSYSSFLRPSNSKLEFKIPCY